MKIQEKMVKQIIVKSNIPSVDYVINPYIGCQHGCVYCYAEFMKRFTDHHEPWGKFIDVKINAPDLIGTKSYVGKNIMLSSVTDCYMPIEAKYQLTRKILEKLVDKQPIIEILTKSRLVTRDIDILKKFHNITIGVSISTLNEQYSRQLEPLAAKPQLRLETLKACKEEGLSTYLFLSPIFPYITEIEKIIELAQDFVDYYMFENLNLRFSNQKKIYLFLEKNCPQLIEKYNEIYFNPLGRNYWEQLGREIMKICNSYHKEARIHFHHGGFKK